MKKAVTVISILCGLIIIGGVLIFTGVIDVNGILNRLKGNSTSAAEAGKAASDNSGDGAGAAETSLYKDAALWVSYMDTCVLLDRNGTVVGTSTDIPEDIMQLSGINITRMVKGAAVEIDDQEAFDYGLEVTVKLAAVGIPDKGEVFISSDHSAIVYLKNIKILLGKEDGLIEKLEALRKFYNKVIALDIAGTLDMQEVSKNKMGYTFRADTGTMETEVSTDDASASDDADNAADDPDNTAENADQDNLSEEYGAGEGGDPGDGDYVEDGDYGDDGDYGEYNADEYDDED